MKKYEKVLDKYINEAPMPQGQAPNSGAMAPGSPPAGGPAPAGGDLGLGGPGGDMGLGGDQQQGGQVPNQLPGDPAGAMKFTQLMSKIAGPKGFLWTTYAKNKTVYPKLCEELADQIKQLAALRNSLDLTLANLSKAIVRNQQADQGEPVDGQ